MIHFTVEAPRGSLTTSPVGAVPGGFRLQIGYGPGVTFSGSTGGASRSESDPVVDVAGHVAMGSDWVLLRDDGVAIFNAKITFEATSPGTHVFDAVLSGRVDIAHLFPPGITAGASGWTGPIRTTEEWKRLDGDLSVILPIQFESSMAAPALATEALRDASKYADIFASLARNQFVASGRIHIRQGAIDSATLEVSSIFEVNAQVGRVARTGNVVRMAAPSSNAERADPLVELILRVETKMVWNEVRKALVKPVADYIKVQMMTQYGVDTGDLSALHKSEWRDASKHIALIKKHYDSQMLSRMRTPFGGAGS